MKSVILYFPYIINLKAFVATEKLSVSIDAADLFLKTMLNEGQIEKACSTYGAVLVYIDVLRITFFLPNFLLNPLLPDNFSP